jgi:hypothetical protein
MGLGQEKLDVYSRSIGYAAWVYEKADSLNGVHRPAFDFDSDFDPDERKSQQNSPGVANRRR